MPRRRLKLSPAAADKPANTCADGPQQPRAAGDLPAEGPEVEVGPVDPLHRQTQRLGLGARLVQRGGLEALHQRRPAVPGHGRTGGGHVVAFERRQRNAGDLGEPDLRREGAVFGIDAVEGGLVVADEVHLVDGQHHLADADQADEIAVAARLRQHALARIDQDHGQVGRGGARDHVACVLLMAGRVGDDELASVRAEEAVGHVDRDALLALGREAVHQQREVDLPALGTPLAAVALDCRQLVLEQHLAVVQQPADQRALAVVDRPAGDEAQQALALMLAQVLAEGLDVADALIARGAVGDEALGDDVEHEHAHADHQHSDDLHDDGHVVPEFYEVESHGTFLLGGLASELGGRCVPVRMPPSVRVTSGCR